MPTSSGSTSTRPGSSGPGSATDVRARRPGSTVTAARTRGSSTFPRGAPRPRAHGALASADSEEERGVDRNAVRLAVARVVVDEPEHVDGLEDLVVFVEELERPVQPEHGLHALVGDKGVGPTWALAQEVPRARDPVVLEIAPAAFERVAGHRPAMAMATEESAGVDSQHIGGAVRAHVEGEVPDPDVLD